MNGAIKIVKIAINLRTLKLLYCISIAFFITEVLYTGYFIWIGL